MRQRWRVLLGIFLLAPVIASALSATSTQVGVKRIRMVRPLQAGASISLATPKAPSGFIGCIVRDAQGRVYLLSAERILSGPAGTPVIHPGWAHGGTERDVVARISRTLPGVGTLAELTVPASAAIGFLRRASPVAANASIGEIVAVFGDEEPYMAGSIDSFEPATATAAVRRIFVGGDWIQQDSGAPVVNDRNEFVGFVSSVREGRLTVVHAGDALKALAVELLPKEIAAK